MAEARAAELSLREARRIVLTAQGFEHPRPSRAPTPRALARTIRQLGLLQIDFVNVLVPAHYQVPFSRLGAYPRAMLDRLVYRRREFTEHWAHEACIVPMETWPLLGYRREAHRMYPWGFSTILEANPDYLDWVLDQVRTRGPLVADELPESHGIERRIAGAWYSTVPRAALESHFGRGLIAVAERRPNFARAYDLTERIVPESYRARRVEREDAHRELLRFASRALGLGTAADLANYYHIPVLEARPRLAELVESGLLRMVRVESWTAPAYLHRSARLPQAVNAASLLSPFDPLIWFRRRAERLFGLEYRLEIFVPQPQRRWGYYVLPFLLGERLVARVDLKADRAARCLRVLAAHLEPGAVAGEVAPALACELAAWAGWLALERVVVEKRGGFSRPLAAACRRTSR